MSHIEWDDGAIKRIYEKIGNQVREVVNTTVQETADDDLEKAVDILHQRLNAIDGLEFERPWSQNAVETLRRGDDLTIDLR